MFSSLWGWWERWNKCTSTILNLEYADLSLNVFTNTSFCMSASACGQKFKQFSSTSPCFLHPHLLLPCFGKSVMTGIQRCIGCWMKALFPQCPVPSQGWMQAWHLLCYTSITRFSSVSESLSPVINAKLLPDTFSCFRGLLPADQRCSGSVCSWACVCQVRGLTRGSPAPVGVGALSLAPALCP